MIKYLNAIRRAGCPGSPDKGIVREFESPVSHKKVKQIVSTVYSYFVSR